MKNKATNTPAPALIINGKNLSILSKDGQWWVAIRPICEALEIDFQAQHKSILNDPILSQLSSEQTMVAADNKVRKMTSLPERYIYGWLFSVRSDSPKLIEYKRECDEVLYHHFHGALTGRMETLAKRSVIDSQIAELKQNMLRSDDALKIQELEKEKKAATRKLKDLDRDLLTTQLSLFPTPAASDN